MPAALRIVMRGCEPIGDAELKLTEEVLSWRNIRLRKRKGTADARLSQTKLAQDGAALESEGLEGRVVCCCWLPPLLSLPSTPVKGEAGRQGVCNSVAPACLSSRLPLRR